jgi:histidine kinase/DNA gyrase B/HSP90-like ATPase
MPLPSQTEIDAANVPSQNPAMANQKKKPAFYDIGKEASKIDVRVSYRIIQLFSDGLYSSPNKAVEELVSNSWDAGAENVHVLVPPDPEVNDGQIVVIDDGIGMDGKGLRQHWLLGDSAKRSPAAIHPKGRKPIGRFGIGKLATYVLAHRLTHISKYGNNYYSTSMDFHRIDKGAGDATTERVVKLSLRKLTEQEAITAVAIWTNGAKPGYKALKLFGNDSAKTWTVAVMSELKSMAKQLHLSRLRWVLGTAMPLSDDFKLFLNGDRVESSKLKTKRVGTWLLGKQLGTAETPLPKPAPEGIELREDANEPKDSPNRFGIFHPKIGRVTGFVEAFEDELGGKSDNWGQSNGFFVHVRGRRINVDDPGFGIDRNLLQHGTFSRFRMVVNLDGLDDDLRSSRETVREGEKLDIARKILQSGFNFARNVLADHAKKAQPGAVTSARVADSPASLTTRPIYGILGEALAGKIIPRYISVPKNLSKREQKTLLEAFENPDDTFKLVEKVDLDFLAPEDGITLYCVNTRVLKINTLHPFVAHFLNEYQSTTRSLPLELLAISEVLLEAHLYQQGGTAVLVVGNCSLGRTFVKNSRGIELLAESVGLAKWRSRKRPLPENRRYLPPPESSSAGKQLKKRMRQEVILTFQK